MKRARISTHFARRPRGCSATHWYFYDELNPVLQRLLHSPAIQLRGNSVFDSDIDTMVSLSQALSRQRLDRKFEGEADSIGELPGAVELYCVVHDLNRLERAVQGFKQSGRSRVEGWVNDAGDPHDEPLVSDGRGGVENDHARHRFSSRIRAVWS